MDSDHHSEFTLRKETFFIPEMPGNYEAAHKSPSGPGDARPTALQILQDEDLVGKLEGKVIFITGCSSGLGVQTAKALYESGATLYLAARDLKKMRAALQVSGIVGSPRVHLLPLDLNSLASVRACADQFKAECSTLNILIANAGVMACAESRTLDGFETQFGVNHLAHFLLLNLLKPILLTSSTPNFNSRYVIVSSVAHNYGDVSFDNINLEGEYNHWKTYGQSKTAGIWTANCVERLYGSNGLHAFSLHPGGIATDLQRHVPEEMKAWAQDKDGARYWKCPEQGAATSVWAAISKELEGKGGKYLENCSIAGPNTPGENGQMAGYAAWAYNPDAEAKLWAKSMEMVGLKE
jgi:NAD(P)-dependent dehydrogenase (short-subunit alcohol dehydrogenase family)